MLFLKKNWWLVFPILIAALLVWIIKTPLVYTISALVGYYILYIVITTTVVKTYIKKNWYIVVGLTISVFYGMSNREGEYWRSFERGSIFTTLLYTIFLYVKMFYDSDVDKKALRAGIPALGIGILAIFISVIASVDGNFQVGSSKAFLNIPGSRDFTLGLLTLGTLMFCIVNYNLFKSNTKHKDTFLKSLQYSDFPVFITFLILWSTVIPFHEHLHDPILEAFYGGTIAFQMIYSNIVWSFIDDPLIESHLNSKTKTTSN